MCSILLREVAFPIVHRFEDHSKTLSTSSWISIVFPLRRPHQLVSQVTYRNQVALINEPAPRGTMRARVGKQKPDATL